MELEGTGRLHEEVTEESGETYNVFSHMTLMGCAPGNHPLCVTHLAV